MRDQPDVGVVMQEPEYDVPDMNIWADVWGAFSCPLPLPRCDDDGTECFDGIFEADSDECEITFGAPRKPDWQAAGYDW